MRPTHGAALLLIVTALVYAPTLTYGWVYEDLNDPERFLRAPLSLSETIREARLHPARVLTGLSYDVSRVIGSPVEPWGFHAVNVVLHLLNSLLLYRLAVKVIAPWAAVGALAIFALHPIQVEAVAYISARADLLMTTAILCALLAVEARQWVLAGMACVCAVGAKELGVVAFPLALLWAVWRGFEVPRAVIGGVIAGVVGSIAYLISFAYAPSLDLTYAGGELIKAFVLLLKIPLPLWFSIDHAWVITPVVAAFGLALTAFLFGCACLSPRSLWSLSVLWLIVCLSPRLAMPLLEGLHEHHLYSISIVIALAIGSLLTVGKDSDGIPAASA